MPFFGRASDATLKCRGDVQDMLDRRAFLVSTGAAALASITPLRVAPAAADTATQDSRQLLDRISDELLTTYPDDATYLGLDVGSRSALQYRLTDQSLEGVASRAAACAASLKQLKAIDSSALPGMDAVNHEATLYAFALADEGYRHFYYGDNVVLHVQQAESNSPYVVSQNTGFFATIPDILDTQHKVESIEDAEAYLTRLSAFAQGLDGETERLRRDVASGATPPNFLLDTTLAQQSAYLAQPVAHWGLVTSLVRRASDKKMQGDWEDRARTICDGEVAPALSRQIAALKELRQHATPDAGCWKLRDGDAYYRWLLKVGTTTSMSPDEVHRLGLQETQRIGNEMDRLLRKQGLTQGGVGARMQALGKDPRFLFPNTDAGRAQLLEYLNGVIAAVRAKLPQAFLTSQNADLVVKQVPPEIELGAPNGYEVDGPIDGSRPAIYYINLRDTANWPRFMLPTVCFHEGLPGHVWQGAFMRALPTIRSQLTFNAYIEGWALYAEQLADELGMYADDPVGRLGYLTEMLLRACRLVVDTGLHARRWTRERAVNWMVEKTGDTVDFVTSEVDRYCASPGQACGYQIGHLRIDGLRTKARNALGKPFNARAFNDVLLTSGCLPLDVLDRVVDGYIAGHRASPVKIA